MADDGRTQFVDGLRVTAEHLQHLQDRLRDGINDIRRTIGLGKIAWGLRVFTGTDQVTITPGVAFAASSARLAIDADRTLPIPAGNGPFRIVLRSVNTDVGAEG